MAVKTKKLKEILVGDKYCTFDTKNFNGNNFHRQYIRKHGRPIGVMVADVVEGEDSRRFLCFGWSLHSDYRTYDKEYGLDVAKARMDSCTIDCFLDNPSDFFYLPQSVKNQADDFIKRVRRIERKRAERAGVVVAQEENEESKC